MESSVEIPGKFFGNFIEIRNGPRMPGYSLDDFERLAVFGILAFPYVFEEWIIMADKMSREEAGRKCGEETARTHDKDFYQEIGRKGGESRGNSGSSDGKMSREEAGRKGGRS